MPRGTTGDLNGSLATLQGDLRKIKYGGDLDVHRWGPHSGSRLSVKHWRQVFGRGVTQTQHGSSHHT